MPRNPKPQAADETNSPATQEPPAMGERRARWGYGYQDKVATAQVLELLRSELREGTPHLEGIRLADLEAGRVDDFVLVFDKKVQGNSIKWSGDPTPVNWGELIGVNGLLRELADGWTRLSKRWTGKDVTVQLQTNRPVSDKVQPAQLISALSVAAFLRDHWASGPLSVDDPEIVAAWRKIAAHVELTPAEFPRFVNACRLRFNVAYSSYMGEASYDQRTYQQQFNNLHSAIATWLTNNPEQNFIDRAYLLSAIGFQGHRSGLIQRFPSSQIPYEKNIESASQIRRLLESTPGGYVAVTGPAGVGKSTLVQDVLSEYPFFLPYFAYLPDGVGNPRDRGEALVFLQDVIMRLDRFLDRRLSVGISDIGQGREALRAHMKKAQELFRSENCKTILLIDGLDQVEREVGLERSLLSELPHPDEVPDGFLIILSSQPQTLLPGVIERHVSGVFVADSHRRITVEGLNREEVHKIVARSGKSFSPDEADSFFNACHGNPLILTYLLKFADENPHVSIAETVHMIGGYTGDIGKYYFSALSVSLRDGTSRSLLALLSRSAPIIPIKWLQTWPERMHLEDLYESQLKPFIRIDNGQLYFIHNSLVAFLKDETRSKLPDADLEEDERRYHAILAERCGQALCSDPLGRAKVHHLLRAEKYRDLLMLLSSSWLREAIALFLPHAQVHPVLLSGISAAWKLNEYGDVLRLILLDYELGQRTSRIQGHELVRKLLALDKADLALGQVRSADRFLFEDKFALQSAYDLWQYAIDHGRPEIEKLSRNIYLHSKPLRFIYRSDPIDIERNHDAIDLLTLWAECAVLFEKPESICAQINRLAFDTVALRPPRTGKAIKAALVYDALSSALVEGASLQDCMPLLKALARLRVPQIYFAALLIAYRFHPTNQILRKLKRIHPHLSPDLDLDRDLAFAEALFDMERREDAKSICEKLAHIRFDDYKSRHSLDLTDITYTIRLRRLQNSLGVAEGAIPAVSDSDEECFARIAQASRELGVLFSQARQGNLPEDLGGTFRALLLFYNRPVSQMPCTSRHKYALARSKPHIYRHITELAALIGQSGLEALTTEFRDLIDGPAGAQFSPEHRRLFAGFFFRTGTLDRAAASALAVSNTEDTTDEDPSRRQETCLDTAIVLHEMGDDDSADEWFRRASRVSSGAGSHKDYHMLQLTEWLNSSLGTSLDERRLSVLEKFVRALEVAGGDGGPRAAKQVLISLVAIDASRASALATELINREVLNVEETLEALVEGGATAGASPPLLRAIYSEMLSLIHTGHTSRAAVKILRRYPQGERTAIAHALMRSVRTNSLPRYRTGVARALQDALLDDGLGSYDLSAGLTPDRDDSSMKSSLYKLPTGPLLTVSQVSLRLSDPDQEEHWNPNPSENGEFDWWSAIKRAKIKTVTHAEKLLATFPPHDYREVDVLAWKSRVFVQMGDIVSARVAAQKAIERAEKGSWFVWFDGAQQLVAHAATKQFDEPKSLQAARELFGKDLVSGNLPHHFLLDEIVDIFEFLQITWPAEDVLEIIDDYLNGVVGGNRQVPKMTALVGSSTSSSVDTALCRFICHFLSFPVVDIGVAARRVMGYYAIDDLPKVLAVLGDGVSLDQVQFEHLLACIQISARSGELHQAIFGGLIQGLDEHESAAVRGIARRICAENGWTWREIRNQPDKPRIILATQRTMKSNSSERVETVRQAADEEMRHLFPRIFSALEAAGNDPEEVRSEFLQRLWQIDENYSWANGQRLANWMRLLRARFWLNPKAIVGREAAMRLLGVRALSGQAPAGVDIAYDILYPLYDPDLELISSTERPEEMKAMDWESLGDGRKRWLNGDDAATWADYPRSIGDFRIIGERTLFIRPDWEWPREERYRGLCVGAPRSDQTRNLLASSRELTYNLYVSGRGQADEQLLIWNSENQLVGPTSRWIALNSTFARSLGWFPSRTRPFEWLDPTGNVMAKSVFWRDGWVGLEPPHFESLGEGCLVLATPAALKLMGDKRPDAYCHLWVERHSNGGDPYHASWHVIAPIGDLISD